MAELLRLAGKKSVWICGGGLSLPLNMVDPDARASDRRLIKVISADECGATTATAHTTRKSTRIQLASREMPKPCFIRAYLRTLLFSVLARVNRIFRIQAEIIPTP